MKIKLLATIIMTGLSVTARANTEIIPENNQWSLDGGDIEYYFADNVDGALVLGANWWPVDVTVEGNNATIDGHAGCTARMGSIQNG
ncbi:hypothetical protein ACU60T_24140 [Klebsiella aerogenes]